MIPLLPVFFDSSRHEAAVSRIIFQTFIGRFGLMIRVAGAWREQGDLHAHLPILLLDAQIQGVISAAPYHDPVSDGKEREGTILPVPFIGGRSENGGDFAAPLLKVELISRKKRLPVAFVIPKSPGHSKLHILFRCLAQAADGIRSGNGIVVFVVGQGRRIAEQQDDAHETRDAEDHPKKRLVVHSLMGLRELKKRGQRNARPGFMQTASRGMIGHLLHLKAAEQPPKPSGR